MRKHLLVAGLAAAALLPSLAFAQQSCEQQRDNRLVGTLAGAGAGALLGGAVAGHSDRTTGVVIGGLGGAIIGNQMAKPKADCAHAYGYYDRGNQWHANGADHGVATGYFDRNGAWVDGAPNGYYDQSGQWVQAGSDASVNGYYDHHGRWIPASANGYYDADGQWVAGAASGYHDLSGRWISGPAVGAYDAGGRWMPGARNSHRDANGVEVADAQPGHYDANGVWRPGQAAGYYDTRGAWIATSSTGPSGVNSNYEHHDDGMSRPRDIRTREAWLEQRIRAGLRDDTLSRRDARRALRNLRAIRNRESDMRRDDGRLSRADEANIQARLDRLSSGLHFSRADGRTDY